MIKSSRLFLVTLVLLTGCRSWQQDVRGSGKSTRTYAEAFNAYADAYTDSAAGNGSEANLRKVSDAERDLKQAPDIPLLLAATYDYGKPYREESAINFLKDIQSGKFLIPELPRIIKYSSAEESLLAVGAAFDIRSPETLKILREEILYEKRTRVALAASHFGRNLSRAGRAEFQICIKMRIKQLSEGGAERNPELLDGLQRSLRSYSRVGSVSSAD